MKQRLIDILESRGYSAYLQGSFNDDAEYPSSFWTFWNFETPETQFYDNASNSAVWGFWVYFYSDDPEKIELEISETIKLLKENGCIISGRGEDVASDTPTHTGRMFTVYILE